MNHDYGFSAAVGAWNVDVSALAGVTAARRAGGPVYSAALTRFPAGYRVSKWWTNGVQTGDPSTLGIPVAVVKKANGLANRLTKDLPL